MMKKKNDLTMVKGVFWALVGVFLLILSQLFVPVITEFLKGPQFLLPHFIFFLLGLVLTFLTLKEGIKGRLKKFLLLTGASASGFFVFAVLHNVFYALEIIFQPITPLKFLMGFLHVCFFFLAIPVCPIGFLVGAVGSGVLLLKK